MPHTVLLLTRFPTHYRRWPLFSEIFLAIINSVGERTSISKVNYGAFLPLEKRGKDFKVHMTIVGEYLDHWTQ